MIKSNVTSNPTNWKAEHGIGEVATLIKGFLRNFAKFTGNHLYQSIFLNKVAGFRATASQFSEDSLAMKKPSSEPKNMSIKYIEYTKRLSIV